MPTHVIILAAGQGTRMRSRLPKVLHPIGDRPLLQHVVDTTLELGAAKISIVFGHGGDQVRDALSDVRAEWIEQKEQLGTGHAVQQVMPYISDDETVLILYGDVPLIAAQTLTRLRDASVDKDFALLTATLDDPTGYGRIVRDDAGKVVCITEEKDADTETRMINEINTGFMAAAGGKLKHWLQQLDSDNAQNEFYLTDIVAMAASEDVDIATEQPAALYEVLGCNNRVQLAELERIYQMNQAVSLMQNGVSLRDPARFDVRGEIESGIDTSIDVNCVFEGRVVLGNGVTIGPNCVLKDAVIGDDVEILANTLIDSASVGDGSRVGPFARLRPDTKIAAKAHIGNFVEIKKSNIGSGSKVNHLSYVGDTDMGSGVNVGAGTITCNYDGANKFVTTIGDDVFIGSDTQLIAPVSVGKGATIGAGTTLTQDAPEDSLTVGRSRQKSINNWKRPVKEQKK